MVFMAGQKSLCPRCLSESGVASWPPVKILSSIQCWWMGMRPGASKVYNTHQYNIIQHISTHLYISVFQFDLWHLLYAHSTKILLFLFSGHLQLSLLKAMPCHVFPWQPSFSAESCFDAQSLNSETSWINFVSGVWKENLNRSA